MVFYAHIFDLNCSYLQNGIPPFMRALIFNGNFVLVTSPLDSIYSSHIEMNVLTHILLHISYINRIGFLKTPFVSAVHIYTVTRTHFGVLSLSN